MKVKRFVNGGMKFLKKKSPEPGTFDWIFCPFTISLPITPMFFSPKVNEGNDKKKLV
jgi:hypothetical protein